VGPGAHPAGGVAGTDDGPRPAAAERRLSGRLALLPAVLPFATAVLLLAAVLLTLFLPAYIHAALDASGAPRILGVTPEQAHALSDRTVHELFFGPATFAFAGPDGRPFYDANEAAHLRDVRVVLFAFLAVAGAALVLALAALAVGWRNAAIWRAIARGGAGLAVVLAFIGVFAIVAFETVFELFHVIFFPGGNWAFDPTTQRLVQLYPLAFWQITAGALGVLAIGGGLLVWLIGRRRSRQLARATA
jgi:integral membrane protein (TIGR01906 family)